VTRNPSSPWEQAGTVVRTYSASKIDRDWGIDTTVDRASLRCYRTCSTGPVQGVPPIDHDDGLDHFLPFRRYCTYRRCPSLSIFRSASAGRDAVAMISSGTETTQPDSQPRRPMMCRENLCRPLLLLTVVLASMALMRWYPAVELVVLSAASGREAPQQQKQTLKSNQMTGEETNSSSPSSLGEQLSQEEHWETNATPAIVWLASYPNSGTSYTMTMVERATNLSTASTYGDEVTDERDDTLPIYPQHPQGPFWKGLSGKLGPSQRFPIRQLPNKYILTKTHCGGRCVRCSAHKYVVDVGSFLRACQCTFGRLHQEIIEAHVPANAIQAVVHLIRNPFHNIVARFHLERQNMIKKLPDLAERYPLDATGFGRWCQDLDHKYSESDPRVFDVETLRLLKAVPLCHAEFYKWTQWHNRVIEMMPYLGQHSQNDDPNQATAARLLTIHYEDYANDQLNATAERIFDFLEQSPVSELRPFRPLPLYEDHYMASDRRAIQELVRHVATDETWKQIQHYFE